MSSSPASFRFTPQVKALLEAAAAAAHRSQANLLEHLLREHCKKEGIVVAGDKSVSPTSSIKGHS